MKPSAPQTGSYTLEVQLQLEIQVEFRNLVSPRSLALWRERGGVLEFLPILFS